MTSVKQDTPALKKATIYYAVRASLVDLLDKPVFVSLRDGSNYVGILSSFDQFSSIVLTEASERIVYENKYADDYIGTRVFRGESLSLIGENNDFKPEFKQYMTNVPLEEVKALANAKKAAGKPDDF